MAFPMGAERRQIGKLPDHIGVSDRRTGFGLRFKVLPHILNRRMHSILSEIQYWVFSNLRVNWLISESHSTMTDIFSVGNCSM